MKQITINRNEYNELLEARNKINALEAAGVDNWALYGDAMDSLNKADDIKEIIENYMTSITETLSDSTYEPSELGAGFAFDDNVQDKTKSLLIECVKSILAYYEITEHHLDMIII